MSFPKINNSQLFEARLQVLHEQMDPVVKMLLNLYLFINQELLSMKLIKQ
jgi:hypothetical protein